MIWRRYLVLLFVLGNFWAYSQPERAFYPGDSTQKSIWLSLDNFNFLKNNEYMNPMAPGYTLLGYHLTPTVDYKINNRLRLRGGLHLLRFSGRDDFREVQPYFSLEYWFSNHFGIDFGAYTVKENLHLSPVIFDVENQINAFVQQGMQFKFRQQHVFGNVWLDWEEFIYKGDPFQESFSIGTDWEWSPWIKANNWKVTFTAQGLVHHNGGQINEADLPVSTLLNTGLSGKIIHHGQGRRQLKKSLGLWHFRYWDFTDAPQMSYENGTAWYGFMDFAVSHLKAETGFFYGNQFVAPRGNPLLQSVSYSDVSLTEPERKLMILSISYRQKPLRQLEIGVAFNGFFDLIESHFDYNYMFVMRFYDVIRLKDLSE
jgi:hypothetical protein